MSIYGCNWLNLYNIDESKGVLSNWLRRNPKGLVLKADQQPEDFLTCGVFWYIKEFIEKKSWVLKALAGDQIKTR